MPTTPEAIRDRIIAVIESLTPEYDPHVEFRRYRNDGDADFEPWCEANAQACRRRFQIRDTGDDEPPAITNGDVDRREVTYRMLVAYPQTGRDGRDGALDRDDTVEQDWHQIDQAVGLNGPARSNFTNPTCDACCLDFEVLDRVKGTAVDFLDIKLRFTFTQTV